MHDSPRSETVLTSRSVEEFFQDALASALHNQQTQASPRTVEYVVNVLTVFARSDRLYEKTEAGIGLKPLALIYADAVYSADPLRRAEALRRLGDVALFISGLFSHSLNRKLVDVDYYMAMGGGAYSELSTARAPGRQMGVPSTVFAELAQKFSRFVDALAEVGQDASFNTDSDLLRTYELWMRTGSRRAASVLRRAGITPTAQDTALTRH
jgi:hypothetical protein